MFVKPAHYVLGWLDMKFNIWHKAVADTEKWINNKKVPCGLEAFSCEHEGKHLLWVLLFAHVGSLLSQLVYNYRQNWLSFSTKTQNSQNSQYFDLMFRESHYSLKTVTKNIKRCPLWKLPKNEANARC